MESARLAHDKLMDEFEDLQAILRKLVNQTQQIIKSPNLAINLPPPEPDEIQMLSCITSACEFLGVRGENLENAETDSVASGRNDSPSDIMPLLEINEVYFFTHQRFYEG